MSERLRADTESAARAKTSRSFTASHATSPEFATDASQQLRELQSTFGNFGAANLLSSVGLPTALQRRVIDERDRGFFILEGNDIANRARSRADAARGAVQGGSSEHARSPAKPKTKGKPGRKPGPTPPRGGSAGAQAREQRAGGRTASTAGAAGHSAGQSLGHDPRGHSQHGRGPTDQDLFPRRGREHDALGGRHRGPQATGHRTGHGAGQGTAHGGGRGTAHRTTHGGGHSDGHGSHRGGGGHGRGHRTTPTPVAEDTAAPPAVDAGGRELIRQELAEHQAWGQATAQVGQAESSTRAAFIAEQVGRGEASGLVQGGAMGFAMGAAGGLMRFAGRYAGPFGAIMGGAVAMYTMCSRQYWHEAWSNITSFGQGSDTYERLANSIAAIGSVIDIANNVLQVVGGICGILTLACWAATALSLGALSPLAATLTSITTAIGVVSMILMALKSVVLDPMVILFRSLHAYKDRADPRDVAAQGERLQSAGAAVGGALGGFIGAKAGEGVVSVGARGVRAVAGRGRQTGSASASAEAAESAAARGGRQRGAVEAEPHGGPQGASAQEVPRPGEPPQTRTDRMAAWLRRKAPGFVEGMNERFGSEGSAQPWLNRNFGPNSRLGRFGAWGERWSARLAWPWERERPPAGGGAGREHEAAPGGTGSTTGDQQPTGGGSRTTTEERPAGGRTTARPEETTQVGISRPEETTQVRARPEETTQVMPAVTDPTATSTGGSHATPPARGGPIPLSSEPHPTMGRVQGTQIGEPVVVRSSIVEAGTAGGGRYHVEGRFSARRVQLASGETVTEITIKVNFERGPVCTDADIALAESAVRSGVHERINSANNMMNGDRVFVRVERAAGPGPDVSNVTIHSADTRPTNRYKQQPDGSWHPDPNGAPMLCDASGNLILDRWGRPQQRHTNSGNYYMEQMTERLPDGSVRVSEVGKTTAAHEQGHSGLGLIDEYWDRTAADRHTAGARGVSRPAENSLMGNFHVEGIETASLLRRHLRQVHSAIEQARTGNPGTIERIWVDPTVAPHNAAVGNDRINITPLSTGPAGPSSVSGGGPTGTVTGGTGGTSGTASTGGGRITRGTTTPIAGAADRTLVTTVPTTETTPVVHSTPDEVTQVRRNPLLDREGTTHTGPDEVTQVRRNPLLDREGTTHTGPDEVTQVRRNPMLDEEAPAPAAAPGTHHDVEVEADLVERAEALRALIPSIRGKCSAISESGRPIRSGFGRNRGSAEGVLAQGRDAGHLFHENSSVDEGTPGLSAASHAEKMSEFVRPGEPIAVDLPMCSDCYRYFQTRARQVGAPLVVADPLHTNVFYPDGTRVVVDANGRTVLPPGDQSASTTPRNMPTGGDTAVPGGHRVVDVVYPHRRGGEGTGVTAGLGREGQVTLEPHRRPGLAGAPEAGPSQTPLRAEDTQIIPVTVDDGRTVVAQVRSGSGGRGVPVGGAQVGATGAFDPDRTYIGPNPLLTGGAGGGVGGGVGGVTPNPGPNQGAIGLTPTQAADAVSRLVQGGVANVGHMPEPPHRSTPAGAVAAAAGSAAARASVPRPLVGSDGGGGGDGNGIPASVGRRLTEQAIAEGEQEGATSGGHEQQQQQQQRGGGGGVGGGGGGGGQTQVSESGHVTERPNPAYRPPPGSLEQVDALETEIASLRQTQATSQRNARHLASESARTSADHAQVSAANQQAAEAGQHVDSHLQQVGERQGANEQQRSTLERAGDRAGDYAGRSAGTATLKGLLRGFSGFLSLFDIQVPLIGGYILPGSVRRGAHSMRSDADGFLANLREADSAMAAQPANIAAGHQEVGANQATLTGVQAQGHGTRQQVTTVQQHGGELATSLATRRNEADRSRAAEQGHASQAGALLGRKQQQHDQLLAALQAWAVEHRAARVGATTQSQARLAGAGMEVTRAEPDAPATR